MDRSVWIGEWRPTDKTPYLRISAEVADDRRAACDIELERWFAPHSLRLVATAKIKCFGTYSSGETIYESQRNLYGGHISYTSLIKSLTMEINRTVKGPTGKPFDAYKSRAIAFTLEGDPIKPAHHRPSVPIRGKPL